MSQSNNNLPIILGVVALLAVGSGAAFYFSKNMSNKGALAIADQSAPSSSETAAAPAAGNGEPPVTAEETKEAEEAAIKFQGVEVKKGNPVVATVDGKDITRVDVFRYIKMMPANVQQLPPQAIYPLALEQVINTRLVQNKAESAGIENDPEVQQQLAMAKQQIIRSVYVQRAVDKEISDADLKKKYDDVVGKTPAIEEVKASHILVDSEAKAKDIIAKLNDGGDFAKLAAENSGDPSNKDKGGDLGWFSKQDMVPEFAEAAFKIPEGKISETPVKTQFGFHVVKVEDKRERPKPSFEEVKPMLQVELRREKLEAMLDGWKSASKVEKFDINGDPLKAQADVAPAAGESSAPAPTPAPVKAE
jgi:peptidyl-prolyl cis-trans isomerase C